MSPKNGDYAKGQRRRRSESRSPSRERKQRKRRERSRSRDRPREVRSRSLSPPPAGGSKRLHIGSIDESIRRRDIEDAFGKYGRLEDIWLASYPPYYAFVVFERAEDASDALSDMRSGFVRDCRVRTTVALPRQNLRRPLPPPRRSYRRSPSPSMSPPARRRKSSRSRSASPRRERDSKDKREKDCKKKREKKSKKRHRSESESS